MGQGQDKVARNLVDLQPTAIVELFLLYFDTVDKENAFIAFHGGSIFADGITWQGIKYLPLPVETEGFEITANGELPRPKIRISNKDYFMTDMLLKNQDFQFAKIIRKRTFVKFLDDINFDGGNPWGEADSSAEISNDTYLIGQKTAENKLYIELELTSPLDLENFELNNRVILSRYCSWYYRGNGCNYDGPPVQSEDGRFLIINQDSVNNWATIKENNEWKVSGVYNSGDPVFILNKKINLANGENAKVWYVCQTGHISTDNDRPDLNQKYWTKDGCAKKINHCQLRFQQSTRQLIVSGEGYITNNYIDFNHLNFENLPSDYQNYYFSNNISPISQTSGSSTPPFNDPAFILKVLFGGGLEKNIKDRKFDNKLWYTPENPPKGTLRTGVIGFTWPTPQTINQINLYSDINKSYSFKTGRILLFNNSANPYETINIGQLPKTNLTGSGIRFASNKIVTSILVSGSGEAKLSPALSEIQILKPSGLGLVFNNNLDKIHLADKLHIATWIKFSSGAPLNEKINIFHNIKRTTNQNRLYDDHHHSGLNLYLTSDKENTYSLNLDFATAYTLTGINGVGTSGDAFQKQTLKIGNWPIDKLMPLHIEIYKGGASGINADLDKIDAEGYIKMYTYGTNMSNQYTLSGIRPYLKTDGKNVTIKINKKDTIVSSEKPSYFKFKNPSYQQEIDTNLYFGIRNYDYNNEQVTSPITIGTTAIWTGDVDPIALDFFERNDEFTLVYNTSIARKVPRKSSEFIENADITGTLLNNLFAWWDMDLSNTTPYVINSFNNPIKTLSLSGNYTSSIEKTETNSYIQTRYINQTPSGWLPFGGFPGTDRYARDSSTT